MNTKDALQIGSAYLMLLGGLSLSVAGFIVPPLGVIDDSIIGVMAECLIYAGSIFGVTIYVNNKYAEMQNYIDKKMKDAKD